MEQVSANPAFTAYVVTAVVLCLNILLLWAYSGAVRVKSSTVMNQEDTESVAKGAHVVEADPPEVARVLRAHRNAADNIVPFLILGYLYVQVGASPAVALGIFGVFTAARLLHSFVYLRGVQPWRTLSFALGGLATLALIVDLLRLTLI